MKFEINVQSANILQHENPKISYLYLFQNNTTKNNIRKYFLMSLISELGHIR